ncbi:hypothetical protein E4U60_005820 [Claviceps pazoutovae]|uniref:Uncharacterized protein n=1 Tax=Claviceps pazoutovae TaxID=1649127 RepID=A0A9P7M7D4_9HYPO|nr:hypothetical protein E4U60_005820 [Claviceps pazoutovae]
MLWRKPPWHQTVHDAAFIIKQQTPITDLSSYTCSPFPIHALIHVASFLLNADVRKPKHEVHIANHIGSLRISVMLPSTVHSSLTSYATIREQDLQSGMNLRQNKVGAPAQGPKDGATPPSTSISTPTSESSSTPLSSISDTIDLYDELLDTIAKWSCNSVAELQKATSTNFVALGLDEHLNTRRLLKSTGAGLPSVFLTNSLTLDHVRRVIHNQNVTVGEESGRYSKTAWVGEKARVVRTAKQIDSKSSPSEMPVSSSTHLLRLVTDALGLHCSGLGSQALDHDKDAGLAAAFFSDNPTAATTQEMIARAKYCREVTVIGDYVKYFAPISHCLHDSAGDARFESTEQDRESHLPGCPDSRKLALSRGSFFHDYRWIWYDETPIAITAHYLTAAGYTLESDVPSARSTTRAVRHWWLVGRLHLCLRGGLQLTMRGEKISAYIVLDIRPSPLIPTSIVTVDFEERLGMLEGVNRARNLLPSTMSLPSPLIDGHAMWLLSGHDMALTTDKMRLPRAAAIGRPRLGIGKALVDMTLSEFEHCFSSWFYGRREQFGMNE